MLTILKRLRRVEAELGNYGVSASHVRWKIILVLAYEHFTAPAVLRGLQPCPDGAGLGETVVRKLLRHFPGLMAYMLLLAHDKAVETSANSAADVHNHLARCLMAFWMGVAPPGSCGASVLRARLANASSIAHSDGLELGPAMSILGAAEFFLRNLASQTADCRLDITQLMYPADAGNEANDKNLNVVSAFLLGEDLRGVREAFLARFPVECLEWHDEFFLRCLLRSGASQVRTVAQRKVGGLDWRSYVDLAIGKSNVFCDAGASLRNFANKEFCLGWRYGLSRFCEQIYLDDMMDIDEDCRDGTLSSLHLFLLEQGRLALRVRELRAAQASCAEFHSTDALASALDESGLLVEYSGEIFLQRNPFRARANSAALEGSGAEEDLRNALCNSNRDWQLPIDQLIERRIAEANTLVLDFEVRDVRNLMCVMFRCGVPERFLECFRQHVRENMAKWRRMDPVYATWISFYVGSISVVFALRRALSWFDAMFKRPRLKVVTGALARARAG
jgi:hypothetical protein